MLNVNFNGRLGADSELRASKNGKQFLSFRVASNEKVNGEDITTWVNVLWTSDRAPKMQEYLKKGKLVDIHGVLRSSLYKTKAGESAVSLDVFADRVDFVSTGTSGGTQSNEATADFGTHKKPEETPVAVAAATEPADDLPF